MNDQITENRIRLVLLEHHGLFRVSLGRFLASKPDLEVVAECCTSAAALEVLRDSAVDVVLLDFDVGRQPGTDFISTAREAGYQGRFLIVAGEADVRSSAVALKLGASGVFLKSEPPNLLVQAIRLVRDGGMWVDQTIIQRLADHVVAWYARSEAQGPRRPLQGREQNVLHGILGGLTNRQIGDNMGLSESTVKNIVQRLFGKGGVKKRSQLVRMALEGSLGIAHEFLKRTNGKRTNCAPPKSQ
jgi:two-component system, NarL family, nitrate/nitrite response regulator NarL